MGKGVQRLLIPGTVWPRLSEKTKQHRENDELILMNTATELENNIFFSNSASAEAFRHLHTAHAIRLTR